jgi:hypothetical protein
MLTFFNTSQICTNSLTSLFNQATLFHEGLHGYTGLFDESLLPLLGYQVADPLIDGTYGIETSIFGVPASQTGETGGNPCAN